MARLLRAHGDPAFKGRRGHREQAHRPGAQEEPTFDDVLFKETEALAQRIVIDPETEDTHVRSTRDGREKWRTRSFRLHARSSRDVGGLAEGPAGHARHRHGRMVLVRGAEIRLVAAAARVKEPDDPENEVVRISANRSVRATACSGSSP
jgi:hypothetical protein